MLGGQPAGEGVEWQNRVKGRPSGPRRTKLGFSTVPSLARQPNTGLNSAPVQTGVEPRRPTAASCCLLGGREQTLSSWEEIAAAFWCHWV